MREYRIKPALTKIVLSLTPSLGKVSYFYKGNKQASIISIIVISILAIYSFSKLKEQRATKILDIKNSEFQSRRVLSGNESFYKRKESILSNKLNSLKKENKELKVFIGSLSERLKTLEENGAPKRDKESQQLPADNNSLIDQSVYPKPIRTDNLQRSEALNLPLSSRVIIASKRKTSKSSYKRRKKLGKRIVSFPVKKIKKNKKYEITLPSGSFVKGVVMTGVDAPQGKSYPSLVQLNYAYVAPNDFRIDLSGCFMIMKAQGNLSTESVNMQAQKISCVSKRGEMFERKVNGYISGAKDNGFGLSGKVRSKQGRVASMAFLSSVVEGVGKSIQMAQTTTQLNTGGGATSILTGSQTKHLAAGGASNAAGLVTQWYLKQAQGLLPSVRIESGRAVWVVMLDRVSLPRSFFKKAKKGANHAFTYISRVNN